VNVYEVLRSPRITEKNTSLADQGKFTFNVAREATKVDVKIAVEKMFNVHVEAVNTITHHGELKRVGPNRHVRSKGSDTKKAIVTLRKGERIALFEAQ
jgi:large subunit ribosomal protein L23